jgi:phosphopantetheinyl transferase
MRLWTLQEDYSKATGSGLATQCLYPDFDLSGGHRHSGDR